MEIVDIPLALVHFNEGMGFINVDARQVNKGVLYFFLIKNSSTKKQKGENVSF